MEIRFMDLLLIVLGIIALVVGYMWHGQETLVDYYLTIIGGVFIGGALAKMSDR